MNAGAVVEDAIVEDTVVTARSDGVNAPASVIQNITIFYGVVARINKVNPLLCVILDGNRRDVIPACRFKIDAVPRVVLNRAAPDAHIR
jgi:hypothetical protein